MHIYLKRKGQWLIVFFSENGEWRFFWLVTWKFKHEFEWAKKPRKSCLREAIYSFACSPRNELHKLLQRVCHNLRAMTKQSKLQHTLPKHFAPLVLRRLLLRGGESRHCVRHFRHETHAQYRMARDTGHRWDYRHTIRAHAQRRTVKIWELVPPPMIELCHARARARARVMKRCIENMPFPIPRYA